MFIKILLTWLIVSIASIASAGELEPCYLFSNDAPVSPMFLNQCIGNIASEINGGLDKYNIPTGRTVQQLQSVDGGLGIEDYLCLSPFKPYCNSDYQLQILSGKNKLRIQASDKVDEGYRYTNIRSYSKPASTDVENAETTIVVDGGFEYRDYIFNKTTIGTSACAYHEYCIPSSDSRVKFSWPFQSTVTIETDGGNCTPSLDLENYYGIAHIYTSDSYFAYDPYVDSGTNTIDLWRHPAFISKTGWYTVVSVGVCYCETVGATCNMTITETSSGRAYLGGGI